VIATGGLSSLVVPYCEEIEEVDDLLTLTGLRLLHELNSS
jgi:type III pantothenate kinase